MATQHLPFPARVAFPKICPRCAYDLAGSSKSDRCPECGLAIDPGSVCIAIACVPKRSAGPAWRRNVWILITIVLFFTLQGWPFIFMISPWLFGLLLLACILATAAMVKTGTAGKRSTERVIFTPAGFVRSTWASDENMTFHPWDGDYNASGKPIGALWQRIVIRHLPEEQSNNGRNAEGKNKYVTLFSAGLRCKRDDLVILAECINAYARSDTPEASMLDVFEDFSDDSPEE